MKIAFVACNKNAGRFRADPSFRYRCENLGICLANQGHRVDFVHLSRFAPWKRYDVAVFHRPHDSVRLRLAILFCRSAKTKVVADLDDCIFLPELAEFSPGVLNGLVPIGWTRRRFAAHRRALALFSWITCSTEPINSHLIDCFPAARTHVIPNAVPFSWTEKAERTNGRSPRRFALSYNPGTRSHDRDFAFISGVLNSALVRHPQLQIVITGPLSVASLTFRERIRHIEKVPFEQYDEIARQGWLNLCPLENTPFNRCKSALKVIEAGFWGIPTLTSPLPDAERFLDAGAVICSTPDDWVCQIHRLLDSPAYYQSLTSNLRERVMKLADPAIMAALWLEMVSNEERASHDFQPGERMSCSA